MKIGSKNSDMNWTCKKFHDLTAEELYSCLKLRSDVFVVEQNCVYPDLDEKDIYCHHLFAAENNQVLAYARIVPPGISYPEPSIGRVVTSAVVRNSGWGKILMRKSIDFCLNEYPGKDICISAQEYLENFYLELGFQRISPTYLEDGIPHLKMMYR